MRVSPTEMVRFTIDVACVRTETSSAAAASCAVVVVVVGVERPKRRGGAEKEPPATLNHTVYTYKRHFHSWDPFH